MTSFDRLTEELPPLDHAGESARLAALRAHKILDTGDEAAFDDLTRLAAAICGTPISLISLLDDKRQWFKSRLGLDLRETSREVAFCNHAVASRKPFVVKDALADPRFASNPLVAADPRVRFYAGVPLIDRGGHALGALCVLDRVPRDLTPDQWEALRVLARHAAELIENRQRRPLEKAPKPESRRVDTAATARGGAAAGPVRPWRKLLVGLTAFATLALTGWATSLTRARLEAEREARFDAHALRVVAALHERMAAYEELLRGAQALFAASREVDRAEWRGYVASTEAVARHPGLRGMGYVQRLGPTELDAFEARARQDVPSFAIRPRGTRPDYRPVLYVEPLEPNRQSLGYDIGSEPARRAASDEAARTGRVAITSRVTLVQDPTAGPAFLMFLPVRPSAAADGPAGWVYAILRMEALMRDLPGSDGEVDVEVFDGAPSYGTLLYDQDAVVRTLDEAGGLRATRGVAMHGREWTFSFVALPPFLAAVPGVAPSAVLGAGLLMSLAFTGVVWSLVLTGGRETARADEMTRAFRVIEARSQAVLDNVVDAILTIDGAGAVASMNRAAIRMFGHPAASVIGKGIETLVDRPSSELRAGYRSEAEGRRANGATFPIDLVVSEMVEDAGTTLVAVVRDLTHQKNAERSLLEVHQRHAQFMEAVPIGIFVIDAGGHPVFANSAAQQILGGGLSSEAVVKSLADVYPAYLAGSDDRYPEDRGPLARALAGQTCRVDDMELRPPGRSIPVEVVATPIYDSGGSIAYAIATLEDVTARRRSEAALREREEHTRAIVTHMLTGLVTTNELGMIESLNPAAEELFAARSADLVGRPLAAVVAKPDLSADAPAVLATRLDQLTEWEARRADGTLFPCEVSLFDFVAGGRTHYAVHLRDITDTREVERLKKEFISTVSHELRTPLTSIRGSLTLLGAGVLGDLPQEALDVVAIAERNSVRLITLLNDILDLERLETGRLEMIFAPVAARAVVERTLESVRGVADAQGVSIETELTAAEVHGDSDRLVQVLVNLVSNAVKFSARGSAVRITLREEPGIVVFGVADRGRGIPSAFRESIFERFKQVEASDSREKGGTGLGLAICRAIVEQHGGRIWVDSVEGQGSTFYFSVPRAGALPGLQPGQAAEPGGAPVLLVEDDDALRGVIARSLQRRGLAVRNARGVAEALAEASQQPRPRLVVLDVSLPDGDGFGLVDALRGAGHAETALLVYTVHDLGQEERKRLVLGPTRVLTKGRAGLEELEAAALELLGVRR